MRVLLASLLVMLGLSSAWAQTNVSLLPPAMAQFADGNGAPYAGGHVYFYVPGTTTPKNTWQDSGGTTLNTNPVILDGSGRAIIWGNGVYREVLQDQFGNTIWDQITSGSAGSSGLALIWYGLAQGTGNSVVLANSSPLTVGNFTGVDGQQIGFRVLANNTGATTVNASAFGAIPLDKPSQSGPVALTGGELSTNGSSGNVVYATYVAALNAFVATGGINGISSVPSGAISPLSFGAKCDGSTDDTSAFQATIAFISTSGGLINVPPGICTIAGTLTIPYNSVKILGAGSVTTELFFTGTGTGDGFQIGSMASSSACTGSTPPTTCEQTSGDEISGMTLAAPTRLGGFLLNINGASRFLASDLYVNGWDIIQTQYVNSPTFWNITGYSHDTSNYVINLIQAITTGTSAGWYRTDAPYFNWVVVNAQGTGGSCFRIDGFVQTVEMYSVHMLNCATALGISNVAGSTSFYPGFIESFDFEADGSTVQGIYIGGGSDFNFVNCDVDVSQSHSAGSYALSIGPDLSGSVTRGFKSSNCSWHDVPATAVFIAAKNVTMTGDHVYDTNHLGSGTYPAVDIASSGVNTDNVLITGSDLGVRFGDPNAPNYGVKVESSITGGIALIGNNYAGGTGTIGSVDNTSGVTIGLTGGTNYAHSAITSVNCAATTVCN